MDEHLSLIHFQVFLLHDFKFGQMSAGRKVISLKVEVSVCVCLCILNMLFAPLECVSVCTCHLGK